MSDNFSLARIDRDAYPAIRGFAYQIDRSVASWLRLGRDEVLELEHGEDIDFIAPAIATSQTDFERTLEQVKCLDSKISLRSKSVKEALCSYCEHLETNLSVSLRFRFFTTATAAEETPPEPLLFVPGLGLWEQIRIGKIPAQGREAAIQSVGSFLRTLPAPSETWASRWQKFLTCTRDLPAFSKIISTLEWSTGQPDPEFAADEVERLLLDLGYASTPQEAKSRHDQLFVFVMRMLAQPKSTAPRRLDRHELEKALQQITPTAAESQILDNFGELRTLLNERFNKVETGISELLKVQQAGVHQIKPVVDPMTTRESFRVASAGLLSWPQTTQGQWLERSELAELEFIIRNNPQSCTVLLGEPGSGKSAILARLGTELEREGTILLALKTDQLPKTIEKVADLDKALDLPAPLVDTVCELARSQPVILVIDQLDALAALMDQHTNRLSALLGVIHRLKDVPNVHLMVSCRRFDYKYDTRLASLKAQEVILSNPPFEAVRPVIERFGIATGAWPADMREMLRNPQHLNLFLTTFVGDPEPQVFETYQAMLNATFQKRVIEQGTSSTVAACEEIASDMGESEELWVGRSKYDERYPGEVDRLIGAGMLEQDGRRIGFRHQTIFDFVRTRAFCSGTRSLADFVLERQNAVFIRSLAWAGFHSLRVCSFERYSVEFAKVWSSTGLRNHLRWLLITFLGQIPDPHLREAQWLLPLLDESSLHSKVLQAVVGNQAWFEKLKSRLPLLMAETDQLLQWQLIFIFRAALNFDRPAVVLLLRQYWTSPEHDALVLQTFYELADWDQEAAHIVEGILVRQPLNHFFVIHLAEKAAEKRSGFGSRIFVAALDRALHPPLEHTSAEQAVGTTADGEQPSRSPSRTRSSLRSVIDSNDWYGAEKIATAEPGDFAQGVLPLVTEVATTLASPANPKIVEYQTGPEIGLDPELRHSQGNVVEALKLSLQKFAEADPNGFEQFAGSVSSNELLLVHRLLAYGLERLAKLKPAAVLAYLLGDQRRLTLGSYSDRHLESKMLISAVAAKLAADQVAPLAEAVGKFRMYPDVKDDDVQARWDRRRWNRQHRLRLLRAFPSDRLSESLKRDREEEEIALPGTPDYDSRIEFLGFVGSPVSSKQMALASDDDILNLFGVLQDGTRMSHPRSPVLGGSHQASQEFANFAKEHPARALGIIMRFQPGAQELPAATAIHTLAECQTVTPEELFAVITALAERGFGSDDFKTFCAWGLEKLARRADGLPDELCELLKSWITPAAAPVAKEEPDQDWLKPAEPTKEEKQQHSLLWSPGGGGILPHGNYPLLRALELGYYSRKPSAIDRWLEVVRLHLDVDEDPAVWRSLLRDFAAFGAANRANALEFITELFRRFPELLAGYEGILFLALAIRWLPASFLKSSLIAVEDSEWELKDQAIGELAMLRFAIDPTDEYCRTVVEDALSAAKSPPVEAKRLGVAFACVNLWTGPSFRKTCHEVLMRLPDLDDEHIPAAIMDVFRLGSIPPDARTKEILGVIAENPELFRRGRPSMITDRIKELLADGFDATLLAHVTRTLLTAVGSAVADIRTAWATNAGDLIEISITLQRLPETREAGLAIFETLLDIGAYEASQVLRELDRRPI